MAEGLLNGILGGDAEEKAAAKEAGPEAFAAAVASSAAKETPEVAAKTVAFFDKHIEVLEIQRKTLEREHEFFEAELGPRLLGVRLRAGFQVFALLVATVIGIGAAIMIRDAITSRRLSSSRLTRHLDSLPKA
jgi:hypothetical protein